MGRGEERERGEREEMGNKCRRGYILKELLKQLLTDKAFCIVQIAEAEKYFLFVL